MQAVLYALAAKFLTQEDLDVLKEEIAMTLLGQMLMEDGIKKGRQEGTLEGIRLTKEVLKLTAYLSFPTTPQDCLTNIIKKQLLILRTGLL